MRLSPAAAAAIKSGVAECFGAGARVFLFGSRVKDEARGGDIDLLVETDLADPAAVSRAEIVFLARLARALGEHKVDLLVSYPGRSSQPEILRVARDTGVLL